MTRRLTPEAATQAAITKQRQARQVEERDKRASEAVRDLEEQDLRALGRKLRDRLQAVVGETLAATFFAQLSGSVAPRNTKQDRFAAADRALKFNVEK